MNNTIIKLVGLEDHKKVLRSSMSKGLPSLLIGETGTGKTSLVKEIASEMKKKVCRITLNGKMTTTQLIGRLDIKEGSIQFREGIVPKAMKEGSALLIDEINSALPDVLFAFHSLLESPPSLLIPDTEEEVFPNEGFCVIATMNPSHEYAGTKELNHALWSRFSLILPFKPLKGSDLVKALSYHVPHAKPDHVLEVATFLEFLFDAKKANKIESRISLREGIYALTYSSNGLSLEESIKHAITNKLQDFEIEMIRPEWKGKAILPQELKSAPIDKLLKRAAECEKAISDMIKLKKELEAYTKLRELLASFIEAQGAR